GYGRGTAALDARIYSIRLAHGDHTALAEYAQWLSQLQPDNIPQGDLAAVFELMWKHPDDPAIRKAADAMFAGADSFWHPDKEHGVAQMINTPMLGFQSFRAQVFKGLDDPTVIGFARNWPGNPNIEVHLNDQGEDGNAQNSPPKTEVRVCDYYAGQLAVVETFPAFQFDWPVPKREAAIAACKAMLKQYGDAYRFYAAGAQSEMNRGNNDHTRPAFSRLDHPATPREVAEGRAIFSLTGKVRVWPMPALPLYADRPASKEDPAQGYQTDENGKSTQVTTYTTEGHVWQAEEVLAGGKWERYYGFVGRHQIEKVPATEINFPPGGVQAWTKITPFFEGAVFVPDAQGMRSMVGLGSYAVTGANVPLKIVFRAHNSNGLDRALPPELTVPPGAKKTLPPAITLKLSYTEKIAPNIARADALPPQHEFFWLSVSPPFDYGEWTELQPDKEVAVSNGKTPGPLVGAASATPVLQIDLRDFFDMTKPGTYRLQVVFGAYGLTPEQMQYRPPIQLTFTVLDQTK
ncbi:MAG TPA: hypothetical protein VG733_05760, partial [Chthoniobacteraceae bacterium]|nr:hypothetical protein [Chthoniobacteraceae bacterium]